jgi:hypothetical protein
LAIRTQRVGLAEMGRDSIGEVLTAIDAALHVGKIN